MLQTPFPDNDFLEMIKTYESIMKKEKEIEKEQLNSSDPKIRISKKIDKMFEDFENNINSKKNKMRYYIHQDINGFSGASRPKEFDPIEVKNNVIKMFDRLEKDLELELEKIRVARKDILGDIDGEIEKIVMLKLRFVKI